MQIENITGYVPKTFKTVEQVSKCFGFDVMQAKVYERIFGLKKIPLAPEKVVEDMLLHVAKQCIDKIGISKKAIKWVIHAHTANWMAPFGMSPIRNFQHALDLPNAISIGTCMSKCGSAFMAFQIADRLFSQLEEEQYILLLIGDVTFTEIVQFIPGSTITSDGACAILLSKREVKNKLISVAINTYGEFAGGIWDSPETQENFEMNYSAYLHQTIKEAIEKANIDVEDVKLILPHNVNLVSWHKIAKLLAISPQKIFLDNVPETAHCFGADPFLNYQSVAARNVLQRGDYYLFATVGLGAVFAVMVFQY